MSYWLHYIERCSPLGINRGTHSLYTYTPERHKPDAGNHMHTYAHTELPLPKLCDYNVIYVYSLYAFPLPEFGVNHHEKKGNPEEVVAFINSHSFFICIFGWLRFVFTYPSLWTQYQCLIDSELNMIFRRPHIYACVCMRTILYGTRSISIMSDDNQWRTDDGI